MKTNDVRRNGNRRTSLLISLEKFTAQVIDAQVDLNLVICIYAPHKDKLKTASGLQEREKNNCNLAAGSFTPFHSRLASPAHKMRGKHPYTYQKRYTKKVISFRIYQQSKISKEIRRPGNSAPRSLVIFSKAYLEYYRL